MRRDSVANLIFVADDDAAVRRSLVMLLEAADYQTGAFASGEALLAALDTSPAELPACAILDVRMGAGMSGLDVQQVLSSRPGPRIPVIMVTGHADVPLAVAAMRAGVKDFIVKPYPADRLLDAIAAALEPVPSPAPALIAQPDLAAQPALPAQPAQPAQPALTAQPALPALTAREMEVLSLLVSGQSNKEIARRLGISHRTVEVHRASMMNRLGARNLADAVRIGLSAGIGEQPHAQSGPPR